MREIRLRWKDRVSHAGHEIKAHARWMRASAEIRRDLEIIVRTANEVYGPNSHWIEEREARQPDRKARLRFDRRVLQGEAAASPYARQLIAGFPRLLFDAPLEREYADHVHDAQRRAALACGWLALAMWVGWAGISAHSPAAPMWWLARGVVALALGAGIYLFSTRRFFVRTDVVAFVILLPLAVATIVHAFMRPGAGLPQGQFAALLLVVAAFFPIGLLLVQSLTAVVAVVLGGAVTAWLALPADTYGATLRLSALLLSTAGVAAVGAYFREHSHRELFLLHELLSRQAHIDPLTGLQNRRGSDHLAQIARLQAIREGVSLSFVVVEIDDPGHPPDRAGDEPAEAMLMQVTKVLSAFARRPLDVTTRLDGHTFGLLLYDCKLEQARQHARRLQEALGALDVGPPGGAAAGRLVVKVNVVQVRPEEKAEDFYRRAGVER